MWLASFDSPSKGKWANPQKIEIKRYLFFLPALATLFRQALTCPQWTGQRVRRPDQS